MQPRIQPVIIETLVDDPVQNPELVRLAELQVNPVLDELNNAFDEFARVVKARPSTSTSAIVEIIREELINYVNIVTMQMNAGNLTGLVNHLVDGRKMTRNIIYVMGQVRIENRVRGFPVNP